MSVARALVAALGLLALAAGSEATVEMQNQARKLGFEVHNCLACHASPHAAEVMKERAKKLNINPGNCLACHGASLPAKLNHRGEWLVAEKARRGAKAFDMSWLKDYKEPTPEPAAKPTPTPAAKDLIHIQDHP
jgi:mono/diheme cytochrome c family protein